MFDRGGRLDVAPPFITFSPQKLVPVRAMISGLGKFSGVAADRRLPCVVRHSSRRAGRWAFGIINVILLECAEVDVICGNVVGGLRSGLFLGFMCAGLKVKSLLRRLRRFQDRVIDNCHPGTVEGSVPRSVADAVRCPMSGNATPGNDGRSGPERAEPPCDSPGYSRSELTDFFGRPFCRRWKFTLVKEEEEEDGKRKK